MSIFQKDFCSISFDSKIFKIFFANKPPAFTRIHLQSIQFHRVRFHIFYRAFSCVFRYQLCALHRNAIQINGANRVFYCRTSSSIVSFIACNYAAYFRTKQKAGLIRLLFRQSFHCKESPVIPYTIKNSLSPPEFLFKNPQAHIYARIISMPKSSIFFTASAAAPLSVTTFVMLLAGQVVI